MMNTGLPPERPRDLPEADALEQQTLILPEGTEEFTVTDPLPDEAPEADVSSNTRTCFPAVQAMRG
jgi:hypothetical protein